MKKLGRASKARRGMAAGWNQLRRKTDAQIRRGIASDPDAHATDEAFWKNAKSGPAHREKHSDHATGGGPAGLVPAAAGLPNAYQRHPKGVYEGAWVRGINLNSCFSHTT